MRHHNRVKKFGRKKNQRKALLRSLVESLILHGKIRTTEARAKALRPFIERLISISRANTLASRRLVTRRLRQSVSVRKLEKEIAPRYTSRAGGYTRIARVGSRLSDGARMAVIELVTDNK